MSSTGLSGALETARRYSAGLFLYVVQTNVFTLLRELVNVVFGAHAATACFFLNSIPLRVRSQTVSESLAPPGVSRPVARTSPVLSSGRRVGVIPWQGPELR